MSSVLLLFLSVFLLSYAVPSSPSPVYAGSRSVLRSISRNAGDRPDFAVDLNASNFDSTLKESPATYAIVEFFANWCPACRNYKPHYEKVARLFNGANASHPGIIYMTRVDCALKINVDLCDKFSISHYPMLFWGPPSKFVAGGWKPKEDNNEIQPIDNGRTAALLLGWINKKIGSSYSLDDAKFENENLHSNVSEPGQIARALYDVEEATTTAFDILLEHNMIKSDTRVPLVKFLQVLVAYHPSKRCRKGSADMLVNIDDLLPSDLLSAGKLESVATIGKESLKNFHICGDEVPRGYWMFCRGSKNNTRGFSCGLWVLLHSISVRVDDGESHFVFTSICDFIHNFFICEECRQHFHEMCSSVSTPFKTTRDFSLWLWSTHNKVNSRLMEVEESLGTGDPKFPKTQWPTKQLCPSCYLSSSEKKNDGVQWNEDEVFKFLVNYYGKMLVSLSNDNNSNAKEAILKEKDRKVQERISEDLAVSTSAVVVPVGAALAIALVSCGFGALACFWRQQQKNRKPRRN
ncbi:sulfhydryl oxidase 2-like isoform X2 [Impatiens glandulifera]|uniref:sulfhydryl oxidase 2-like isoform X2 n=1 Tax=Impatiens glandulifera TaxID=253017 RepID=UPI001FB14DAA|nr:sulfhydryl oxidase 2-like isoform X2 [Impatiens glandulifera]